MANQYGQRDESAGWDRVGWFMQDMGTVTQNIWARNLRLWNSVSERLRADRYTADAMADDAAKAMATAMADLDDVWSFWTRVPERERVATALPTAFLLFAWRDETAPTHIPPDPVLIRAPFADGTNLPARAEVALQGPSDEAVDALRACLTVRLETGPAYRIETHDVGELTQGVYDGVVYITDPGRPLAELRVVVEGPGIRR
jgi:hypothetical protein